MGFYSLIAQIAFYTSLGIVAGGAHERDLNPYPYFYDNGGEYAAELSDTGRKKSLKLGVNYLFQKPNAFEINTLYKPLPILGVEASHIHFSERHNLNTDVLDITSLMVNYHRVREKNISLWWGLGVTYVGNEVNKLGFSYSIGAEIYPIKPISLHLSWKEIFINQNEIGVLKYHFQVASEDISGLAIGFEITF